MAKTLQELIDRYKSVYMDNPPVASAQYTCLWLDNDGESTHGSGVQYKTAPAEFKTEIAPDGSLKIKGYASTNDLDHDNEIILPEAYKSSKAQFLKDGGKMLFMHDWWSIPIGKWDKATIDDKGLFLEGRILPTTEGKDIQIMVEAGVIKTLSVGFRMKSSEIDHDTGVRTITDLELLETSIVNIPANPAAIFEVAKQLELKSFLPERSPGPNKRKDSTMELSERIEALEKTLGMTTGTVGEAEIKLAKNVDEIKRLEKLITDMAAAVKDQKDTATMADFDQLAVKVKEDFQVLVDENKSIKLQIKEASRDKMVVTDFRSLLPNKAFLFDQKGRPMSDLHQQAYKLFNLDVDYDKSEAGPMLKAARQLNDLCVITDAYMRGNMSKASSYMAAGGMYSLECYKALTSVVEGFDPILAKGMGTDIPTAGGNWLPTLFSAQVESLFRLTPRLRQFMRPMWSQPSGTAKWPIITGAAQAFLSDEASADNPNVLEKSNFTTNAVTFTPRTFATAIPISRELIEDDFTDIVGAIQEELVMTQEDAFEDAIINGDDSATHFDTGRSLTSSSNDTKVAFKGMRKIAIDRSNTWDTQSTSLGDSSSTFTAPDVRFNRQKLSTIGLDPSRLMHLTGPIAYFKALSFSQVTKANEFGFPSTWLTGVLPALDGVEIYISAHFPEDLNASGVFDDSTTDNTAWITFHKDSFMPSERRGLSLEFQYTPNTQQTIFVGTTRRDFQDIRTSGAPHSVAYGFNIDN